MYSEFIVMYICMAVIAVLVTAVIVLLIKLLRKMDDAKHWKNMTAIAIRNAENVAEAKICQKCGTAYDASMTSCPRCQASTDPEK